MSWFAALLYIFFSTIIIFIWRLILAEEIKITIEKHDSSDPFDGKHAFYIKKSQEKNHE